METVVLAFQGEKTPKHIRMLLEQNGIAHTLHCRSGAEVRRLVRKQGMTTVICGYRLPDGTAEDLFADLPQGCSMLLIAGQSELNMCHNDDMFKLAAPVARRDLLASVEMLLQMGGQGTRHTHPIRNQAEDVLIAQAKGILMERHDMTEVQAHHCLQKRSMDSGVKMAQTAQMVLGETWGL